MLDYQPDYRAIYNPAFVRKADENRKKRAALKDIEDKRRREEERLAKLHKAAEEAEQKKIARLEALHNERLQQAIKEIERKRDLEMADVKQEIAELRGEIASLQKPAPSYLTVTTTYQQIERRISKATGVSPKEIRGSRRFKEVVLARQAISYWAIRLTQLSYPQVARLMGGRDHTSVIHGARAYVEKRAKEGKHRRKAR